MQVKGYFAHIHACISQQLFGMFDTETVNPLQHRHFCFLFHDTRQMRLADIEPLAIEGYSRFGNIMFPQQVHKLLHQGRTLSDVPQVGYVHQPDCYLYVHRFLLFIAPWRVLLCGHQLKTIKNICCCFAHRAFHLIANDKLSTIILR